MDRYCCGLTCVASGITHELVALCHQLRVRLSDVQTTILYHPDAIVELAVEQ